MVRNILYFFICCFFISCDNMLLGDEEQPLSIEENLQVPANMEDGLEISTPTLEGINDEAVKMIIRNMQNNQVNIHSILIARNNKLVAEAYFNGWNAKRKHDLRSATKSFTSCLMGIAFDQKLISDIDVPVLSFFPEYMPVQNSTSEKEKMSIKNFLQMRTGLACNDMDPSSPGNEEKIYRENNWVRFMLDLPVNSSPGKFFYYCTGSPVTLGAIITKVSDKTIPDFAKINLFDPLMIRDYAWEPTSEGGTDTGGHLHLSSRAMVKFGLLFSNGGNFNGNQVVSQQWIDESTTSPEIVQYMNDNPVGYAYLWWTIEWMVNGKKIPCFYASGNGGQFIFVVPSMKLVVVFTGGNYNKDTPTPFSVMQYSLLPAVK